MVRKYAVLGLCFAAGLFAASAVSFADDKKTPAVKDCMKFQGKNGLSTPPRNTSSTANSFALPTP